MAGHDCCQVLVSQANPKPAKEACMQWNVLHKGTVDGHDILQPLCMNSLCVPCRQMRRIPAWYWVFVTLLIHLLRCRNKHCTRLVYLVYSVDSALPPPLPAKRLNRCICGESGNRKLLTPTFFRKLKKSSINVTSRHVTGSQTPFLNPDHYQN